MKNQHSEGVAVSVPLAPYAVASGAGCLIGSLFGIAATTALINTPVVLWTRGAFTLAKLSAQAWTMGVLIYWDDTAKNCTTVSTSNKIIGTALAIAANPTATGIVRLNGVATS
jgi:predicted RecA/RadA family phage recombinase